jgi:hypothetical protein
MDCFVAALLAMTSSDRRAFAPLCHAGLSGYVPPDCERSVLLVPVSYAPWLWGWPNRFLNRMIAHGSAVFIIGRHDGEDFSSGIDQPEDLALLPPGLCRRDLDQPDRPHRAGHATSEHETVSY